MALLLKPKRHLFPSSARHLRRLCDAAPTLAPPPEPEPEPELEPEPALAPSLTTAETKLLDALHAALVDHRRAHPAAPVPATAPSEPPLPELSSALSGLLASPPSPQLPLGLLRRLLALRRGVPLPEAVAFFHHVLPSLPPDSLPALYAAMIDLLAKHHHFPLARHLLDEMRERSVPISAQLILALIRRYVRAEMPSEASDLFRRMEEYGAGAPDPATLASLLGALSKKRLASEAQAMFDSYKSVFTPDVVLYTTLVHAWCRSGRLDEAERVFAEMQQAGVTPNVYTYTAVIDAMYRAGQVPRAQELLCQMIDSGCPPNTATFNAIMRAHVKAGRSEHVLQVHNQMRQLGCEPDIITYNFLMETHCGKGQSNLDAAMKMLTRMIAKGCIPDCHTFNPMLKLVLVLGNVNAARKLYERMQELQCKPNVVTYNLLMRLFNLEKSMDMVLRIKKDMDAQGVEPNVNTYAALIEAFCGRGNWKRAHMTLREMVEEKALKPTKPVYDMVLALLRKAGQLRRHEELVEMMVDRGFISRPANDALWRAISA
ncbi:pentatricopeptide repeat-containing protein At1g20300, mitochondrial-like [Oryza glaberrima]|uniref:Pentacotripeptide-repeat region of PRORP domain-containing protein n=1 Tax=Oryza glaberrima TaxID=4538 RepID=I1QQW7_ORYGL|nr:pentatricopeptide repeat-containing protein At1g20300, mitochondrial-like [Oryza glaberrima]